MNQERNTTHTKQVRTAGISALIAMTLAAAFPALAGTAADKCEGGKNGAAGTYFNCLAKAEKDFVTKGDVDKYDASVLKCETKLQATWDKLEAAATAAGDPCPNVGDALGVKDLLDGCSGGVSESAAGGTPPPSPLVCEADLATCDGELMTCESTSGLPVTGQTTSYGPGSDGAAQRGAARSFTDNGDGTITDNVTGLMWEKKSDDGSIHDKDTTYTWGMNSAPYTMNGTMVTTFLAALNGGGGFAGYTDWRIPNVYELQSLVNFAVSNPSAFSEFNSTCTGGCTVTTCSCTRSNTHWSSTTIEATPTSAWIVGFNGGGTGGDDKTGSYYVRAVRAGS